jgi:L-2,4-diaminobutyrate decarboxylase
MQRSIKANSPYMVKNIIPQPSFVYLAAYLSSSLYMANAVTGEDAGEALKSELACAASIARLAGMDPQQASGVFTFGGTGTNLYALKIGLTKASPDYLIDGLNSNNLFVVGNKASHYSQQTAASWLGIGQSNYIKVKTNVDQTTNLEDLEMTCVRLLKEGKRIACIETVGGTTSHMAIDDIEKIYEMREKLVADFNLDYSPHLHVDSVWGWVWLNFVNYDFDSNPLQFEPQLLEKIEQKAHKVSKFKFADSFGVDFHKSGYIPYNSSMIILKNKDNFNLLKRPKDIMTPLFHDDEEYNPGVYTLETSRSCANILATWTTLKSLGQEGYQVLLGNAVSMRQLFVDAHSRFNKVGILVENTDLCTVDIFLRCIGTGADVQEEHEKELVDDDILNKNSKYTNDFFKWFTSTYQDQNPDVAVSKSTASFYSHNGSPLAAWRICLMSSNNTKETISYIIDYIIEAKEVFDKTYVYK